MRSYYVELGKMLHNLRISCDFKQETVGQAFGISRSTYGEMERAVIRPQIDQLFKLAALYQIPPEVFLYPEEYKGLDNARKRASKKESE